jgi:probable HAF family extracellular repeat protein
MFGLSLAIACQCALGQAMYRIKPLGYLGGCTATVAVATDFNNANQVTGQACNANGDQHAFVWRNDGKPMVDLGPDEVGSTSVGSAINASGLVAGTAWDSTGQFGFVLSGDGKPMRRIYNSWGGTDVRANALNDSGQVTGSAQLASPYDISDAFVWKNDGTMLDLENYKVLGHIYSAGAVINSSGQVAGSAGDNDRETFAFVWKNDGSPVMDLGGLGC